MSGKPSGKVAVVTGFKESRFDRHTWRPRGRVRGGELLSSKEGADRVSRDYPKGKGRRSMQTCWRNGAFWRIQEGSGELMWRTTAFTSFHRSSICEHFIKQLI